VGELLRLERSVLALAKPRPAKRVRQRRAIDAIA
jgi:hypothetical protein